MVSFILSVALTYITIVNAMVIYINNIFTDTKAMSTRQTEMPEHLRISLLSFSVTSMVANKLLSILSVVFMRTVYM